jgi:hypothetical protein
MQGYLECKVEPPELSELLGDATELPLLKAVLTLVPSPQRAPHGPLALPHRDALVQGAPPQRRSSLIVYHPIVVHLCHLLPCRCRRWVGGERCASHGGIHEARPPRRGVSQGQGERGRDEVE